MTRESLELIEGAERYLKAYMPLYTSWELQCERAFSTMQILTWFSLKALNAFESDAFEILTIAAFTCKPLEILNRYRHDIWLISFWGTAVNMFLTNSWLFASSGESHLKYIQWLEFVLSKSFECCHNRGFLNNLKFGNINTDLENSQQAWWSS